MTRIAIIDHDAHRLWIEDVSDEIIDKCGGEQEYIDAQYGLSNYSWDYIIDACYIPDNDYSEVHDIDFGQISIS